MLALRLFIATVSILALTSMASAQEHAPDAAPPAKAKRAPVELPHINFKSLDDKTDLIAHIFRPPANKAGDTPNDEPRAAVVMMHGCSGLIGSGGRFFSSYRQWASEFLKGGYVVLVVDSAKSRGLGQTCSRSDVRDTIYRARPFDAFAALQYLQTQSDVAPDRIGLVGWSQGGGTVLLSVHDKSYARPQDLKHDFRAAVAFYPALCSDAALSRPNTRVEPMSWTTTVPLLVLTGADDVWTPPKPCVDFIEAAKARGNPVEIRTYANSVHSFDAPGLKRRELTQYRLRDGTVPVSGTNAEARADVLVRVPAFLSEKLNK